MYTQLDGRFIEETLTPAQLVERSGESRDPERVHGKGLVIPRRRSTKKRRGETSTLRTVAPRRSAKVEATMQEVSVGGVDDERGGCGTPRAGARRRRRPRAETGGAAGGMAEATSRERIGRSGQPATGCLWSLEAETTAKADGLGSGLSLD
jgi:hypothetical protein